MSSKANKFPVEVDLQSRTPAYLQIILQIQGLILNGGLKSGEQLPTVRSLAAALSINFNTVARAYRLLDRAGLITTQQGRGTFVVHSAKSTVNIEDHRKLREEALQAMTVQYLEEAKQLDFEPAEVQEVFCRNIERWIIHTETQSSDA